MNSDRFANSSSFFTVHGLWIPHGPEVVENPFGRPHVLGGDLGEDRIYVATFTHVVDRSHVPLLALQLLRLPRPVSWSISPIIGTGMSISPPLLPPPGLLDELDRHVGDDRSVTSLARVRGDNSFRPFGIEATSKEDEDALEVFQLTAYRLPQGPPLDKTCTDERVHRTEAR